MYDTDHPKLKAATRCDSEEIINQLEVAFGIELDPEECERMITLGDLHSAILEKLGPDLGQGCVSQAAFYRVRRVLMEHYGVSRDAIRLDCNLLDLTPALKSMKTRRREWKALSNRLECYLPELKLSKIDSAILLFSALACLAPVCLAFIYLAPTRLSLSLLPILFLLALELLGVIIKLFNRLALSRFVIFPKECTTVAGLVKTITQRNYGTIARQRGFRNEGDVWNVVAEIIINANGVKPEEVRKDTRFQEDLKVD